MTVHSRDRRKWFAVHFGNRYFRSQPLINPSLAFALAAPCLALALLALVMLDGEFMSGAGIALAISPLLAQKREEASRALTAAKTIRDKYAGKIDGWTAEDTANFDKAMADFAAANNDVVLMQAREDRMAELEKGEAHYLRAPAPNLNPGQPERQSIGEAFGRYIRGAKLNAKSGLVEVEDMHQATVDACHKFHRRAFRAYLHGGEAELAAFAQQHRSEVPIQEVHALVSSDQTLGGFLVPEDWKAEVIKAEIGFAVLAPLVRVEPTNRDTLVMPKMKPHTTDIRRSSGFAGQWQTQGYVTGGTAPTVQNQPTFQQERIAVHDWQPDAIEASPNLLEDSGANVEGIIAEAIGETLAFDKDDVILNGTGVARPEGVLQAGITTVASGSASAITYGGVIDVYTYLPAQYRRNATWVMSSKTMGHVLKLNTGTGGVYLFPPNNWNNQILNRPVVFMDYGMDEPASDNTFTAATKPIIFGDFRRYIMAQRQELRIQRLIERFAPNIGFLPTARLGGQVVLVQAFRIMTIAAS